MKITLLCLALPLSGCVSLNVFAHVHAGSSSSIKGSGKPIVETRKAAAVTSVEASGAVEVTILPGATPKLTVEAQKEILPHIKTLFENGKLTISTEGSISTDEGMKVRVTLPSLHDVAASGATKIDVSNLAGEAGKITATGASNVKAVGSLTSLQLILSGASEVDVKSVKAPNVNVEATGASRAWVSSANSLTATASGASEVHYLGKPTKIVSNTTGASSITQG